MSVTQKIYHRMPAWSRDLAASLRGYYLNRWRYDEKTESLVEQILERDYWSAGEWREWREKRLAFILNRAMQRVPFYREQWARRRQAGDKSSPEYLENWQVLDKKTLRGNEKKFVADDCRTSRMFHDHTSGTTGTSLNLYANESTVKLWYAMFEARSRRWYGVSRQDRWAILGGQLVVSVRNRRPPFWVWNRAMNQLYLSSYHLAPELIGFYIDVLVKYRVRYILGYPSAIYALAREIVRKGRKDARPDVVIVNAEPLYDFQREIIAEAFSCPVRETYGMAEAVAGASECEQGNLHQWLDAGVIEGDGARSPDKTHDFVCTGLVNADMPLVRYQVGDCGSFSNETCDCGRKLPLFEKIEGRTDDVLYAADGRHVGRLDPVFKNDLPLLEAQIIQQKLDEITIKFVPTSEFSRKTEKILTDRLRERMGDVRVRLEAVKEIPRTSNGKFRAVICHLPKEQAARLDS